MPPIETLTPKPATIETRSNGEKKENIRRLKRDQKPTKPVPNSATLFAASHPLIAVQNYKSTALPVPRQSSIESRGSEKSESS